MQNQQNEPSDVDGMKIKMSIFLVTLICKVANPEMQYQLVLLNKPHIASSFSALNFMYIDAYFALWDITLRVEIIDPKGKKYYIWLPLWYREKCGLIDNICLYEQKGK